MTKRPPVFTFWEPRGAVTPWLQLCRDTWRRGLDSDAVVTLDYANLGEYLPPERSISTRSAAFR